ncbi:hypothetical protein DSO57_1017241 [Entomophthora muscae]|uniref:Uncharacterized protein n=1 Tax=Entomophthora muscae TaxID=34485 RepID=A0ACC2TG10_9FUNG|nr:hypothetical protein DSO57_1017241 [Entomophthora muscae]
MASEPDPGQFKGPGEKPILGEEFLDPASVNISLLLSGKVANAFLTFMYLKGSSQHVLLQGGQ